MGGTSGDENIGGGPYYEQRPIINRMKKTPIKIKINWDIEAESWSKWLIERAVFFDVSFRERRVLTSDELDFWYAEQVLDR